MADDRTPLDRALDLLVYAPLGLALVARDHLPRFADEGRRRLSGQARMARMVGEMAVKEGRRQVQSVLERRPKQPSGPGLGPGAATGPHTSSGEAGEGVPVDIRVPGPEGPSPDGHEVPAAGDLPIPGYDSLAASQVVQRLPGLSPEELEAVRDYEAAGRNRKTVLLRVAQLRA